MRYRVGVLVIALLVAVPALARAETFELATFAAPREWKAVSGGYQRTAATGGVGYIKLLPGHAASRLSVAQEFAAMWRARVTPDLAGATPLAIPTPETGVEG